MAGKLLELVDKKRWLSYIGSMGENEELLEKTDQEEKSREIDLNSLFPERELDLNHLFPDQGTKKLLYDLKRNKRDIERFIKSLNVEEE